MNDKNRPIVLHGGYSNINEAMVHAIARGELMFVMSGDPDPPGQIVSAYEIELAKQIKQECRATAALMAECMYEGTPVQDEDDGHWMTKSEVILKTQQSWAKEMLSKGWEPEKVQELVRIIGL